MLYSWKKTLVVSIGFAMGLVILNCQTPTADGPPSDDEVAEVPVEDPGPEAAQPDRFVDEGQRFSAPIPTNWTVQERDGLATLSDPQHGVRVHLTAMEGTDIEAAIEAVWAQLDDVGPFEPERVMNPPAPQGFEAMTVIHYDTDDDEFLAQALGQLLDGVVYVALIEGDIAAVQRRAAHIQIIVSGFRPTALERVDLSQAQAETLTDEHLSQLREHIEEAMGAFGIPGASIGIVQNDEVVFEESFGLRQVGSEEPVTPDTLMMLGSTTKTMTTLLMAMLVDEGIMEWDTPAIDILPEFSVADADLTQAITVRNLVCACTGVPRRDWEIIFNYRSLTAEDVVDSLGTFEFFTDFGEAFQYSNQMVAVGGYVAAAALTSAYGQLHDGYVEAMTERVFAPIGMTNTTVDFDEAMSNGNFAWPHSLDLDVEYVAIDFDIERFVDPLAPAGAGWSNTRDMNLYLLTMLAAGVAPEGERVVSEENLRETWQPQIAISDTDDYGLGWIVSDYYGQPMISHGGNTMGFTSELAFFPGADVGITILVNGGAANFFTSSVRARLLEVLYDQPQRSEEDLVFGANMLGEQYEQLRGRLAGEVDTEAVAPYLGGFENDDLGRIVLEQREGRIFVDAGEFTTELRQVEDADRLVLMTVDPPLIGFEFRAVLDDDGEPTLRAGAGAMMYIFERVDL